MISDDNGGGGDYGESSHAAEIIPPSLSLSKREIVRERFYRRNYRRINRPRECVSLIKTLAMIINTRSGEPSRSTDVM